MKRWPTEWEVILAKHVYDKGLLSDLLEGERVWSLERSEKASQGSSGTACTKAVSENRRRALMESIDIEEVKSGSLGTDGLCGFNSSILVRLSARRGPSPAFRKEKEG